MLRRPPRPDGALFGALLAFWCFESLVWLQTDLRFTADAERDLLLVRALVVHGIWPPHGIPQAPIGLDIGPLYYLLAAPFVAVWPSPFTVHALNVGVHALGLTAFWALLRSRAGAAGALIACLLYTQSAAQGAFVDTAWHAAAAPGVALALVAAGGWWAETGRFGALLCCAGLFALGFQIHASLLTFGPAALLLLWARRADLTPSRALWALGLATVVLLPFLLHLLGILGEGAQPGMRHGGDFSLDFAAFFSGLFDLLRARWLLGPALTPWVTLALAGLSTAGAVAAVRSGFRPWLRLALLVQVAFGGLCTARALGFEHSARYFVPVVGPLMALAALGVREADGLLAAAGRSAVARALHWAALVALLVVLRSAPNEGRPPAETLTLTEQEAVVQTLSSEHGLAGPLLLRRTHGMLQGTLSGTRYLAAVWAPLGAGTLEPGHWVVQPATRAPPMPDRVLERVDIAGTRRVLTLLRVEPAVDYARIRSATRPCPTPVPYSWSEVRPAILAAAGFGPSALPDPTACGAGDAIELEVPLLEGAAQLTVQLTDDGHFRGDEREPLRARLRLGELPPIGLSLTPTATEGKRSYGIAVPGMDAERTLLLTIRPRGHLGFLDLF